MIRRLGCHEGYQLAMHTLDQYRGTIVSCRYSLPPNLTHQDALGTLKARFCEAVAHVVLAQSHLQVGIVGENTKDPAFVCLDHLDFRNHVDWNTFDNFDDLESHYSATAQFQLDARYTHLATQPGWRVIVLQKVGADYLEVLYVWNHPHHDGMSGKIFHEQLLQSLNRSVDEKNGNDLVDKKNQQDLDTWVLHLPDSSDTLPPPPEVLSPWPMSTAFLLKALWKELKPLSIFPAGDTYATWAPIQAAPYMTQRRTFVVDSDTVTKLVDVCRQNHTTLTGLFHALVLISLVSTVEEAKGFASRTPYDLRHFLPSNTPAYPWLRPKESMCNYVSVIDHEFDVELVANIRSKISPEATSPSLSTDIMDIVWPVSARVRREIKARLDSGINNDMIGIMKFVRDWRPQQQSEARKPRYLSWLVTNLGVLDGEVSETQQEYDERWSICQADLMLSAEVPSAALSVSIMTVKDKQMCVTCTWQDCAVETQVGDRLMSDLERWLSEIAS
ncbi:hypothetical protein Hte_005196 [Hypoxylon texense]